MEFSQSETWKYFFLKEKHALVHLWRIDATNLHGIVKMSLILTVRGLKEADRFAVEDSFMLL